MFFNRKCLFMKTKILLMLAVILSSAALSSCMTIFSNSRQTVTFMGEDGTRIYDGTNNVKLSEIKDGGVTTVKLKKKLSDKI